jgi:hypothetical protein
MCSMSLQTVQSAPIPPAVELCILLEIIEAVSSDECGGSVPFKAAAVNYLAGRARVIAGDFADACDQHDGKGSSDAKDNVMLFAGDNLIEASQSTLTAAEIWKAYRIWCRNNEAPPVTQTMLGRRLRALGYNKKESNGVVRYVGVALFAPEPEAEKA